MVCYYYLYFTHSIIIIIIINITFIIIYHDTKQSKHIMIYKILYMLY